MNSNLFEIKNELTDAVETIVGFLERATDASISFTQASLGTL